MSLQGWGGYSTERNMPVTREMCATQGRGEAQNGRCDNEEGDVMMHFVPIPQRCLCAEYNPTNIRAPIGNDSVQHGPGTKCGYEGKYSSIHQHSYAHLDIKVF